MIVVDFLTTDRQVYENSKIVEGVKHIPEWFKNLKPKIFSPVIDGGVGYTMKTCPGFINLYKQSFMMPLWCDVNLSVAENGSDHASWYTPNNNSKIEAHNSMQFDGFAGGEWQHLKFDCPWYVKSSKPLDFCFVQPIWNDIDQTKNLRILPGIVGTQKSQTISFNVNLMVKREVSHEYYQLEFGIPFVQLLPLTTETIKLKHHLIDEKEAEYLYSPFSNRQKFRGAYEALKRKVSMK